MPDPRKPSGTLVGPWTAGGYSEAWVQWKVGELLEAPDEVLMMVIKGIQNAMEERLKHGE